MNPWTLRRRFWGVAITKVRIAGLLELESAGHLNIAEIPPTDD